MNLERTNKLAQDGLSFNKVRSFLTTLGVIIGVAAVIIMLAVSSGAEPAYVDQINALGPNLIMVMSLLKVGGFGPGSTGSSGFACEDIDGVAQNVSGINWQSMQQVAFS